MGAHFITFYLVTITNTGSILSTGWSYHGHLDCYIGWTGWRIEQAASVGGALIWCCDKRLLELRLSLLYSEEFLLFSLSSKPRQRSSPDTILSKQYVLILISEVDLDFSRYGFKPINKPSLCIKKNLKKGRAKSYQWKMSRLKGSPSGPPLICLRDQSRTHLVLSRSRLPCTVLHRCYWWESRAEPTPDPSERVWRVVS